MSRPTPIFDSYVLFRLTTNGDTSGTIRTPEIVEVAALVVDAHCVGPVAEFHAFVRPNLHTSVAASVTHASGVTQAHVDAAKPFGEVCDDLRAWLRLLGLDAATPTRAADTVAAENSEPARHSLCVVTCGGPDLARALRHDEQAAAESAATRGSHAEKETGMPCSFTANWAALSLLYTRFANKKAKRVDEAVGKHLTAASPASAILVDEAIAAAWGGSDGALTLSQREVRLGAKALMGLLHLGQRPDFTTIKDETSATAQRWTSGPLSPAIARVSRGDASRLHTTTGDGVRSPTSQAADGSSEPGSMGEPAAVVPSATMLTSPRSSRSGLVVDDDDAGEHADGECADANEPMARCGSGGNDAAIGGDGDSHQSRRPAAASATRGRLLPPLEKLRAPRDPAHDILFVEHVRRSMQPEEFKALIKKLNVFLRCDALDLGIDMTIDGYVSLDSLLSHPRFRQVKRAPIAVICIENERNRFDMVYNRHGHVFIRANHAHNIEGIDFNLAPLAIGEGPRYAIHGTNIKHWPSILREGISRMARRFVTLSAFEPVVDDADEVAAAAAGDSGPVLVAADLAATAGHGLRPNASCFICVDVAGLLRDGIPCYVNANRAIVTYGVDGSVPPEYFVAACDLDSNPLPCRSNDSVDE